MGDKKLNEVLKDELKDLGQNAFGTTQTDEIDPPYKGRFQKELNREVRKSIDLLDTPKNPVGETETKAHRVKNTKETKGGKNRGLDYRNVLNFDINSSLTGRAGLEENPGNEEPLRRRETRAEFMFPLSHAIGKVLNFDNPANAIEFGPYTVSSRYGLSGGVNQFSRILQWTDFAGIQRDLLTQIQSRQITSVGLKLRANVQLADTKFKDESFPTVLSGHVLWGGADVFGNNTDRTGTHTGFGVKLSALGDIFEAGYDWDFTTRGSKLFVPGTASKNTETAAGNNRSGYVTVGIPWNSGGSFSAKIYAGVRYGTTSDISAKRFEVINKDQIQQATNIPNAIFVPDQFLQQIQGDYFTLLVGSKFNFGGQRISFKPSTDQYVENTTSLNTPDVQQDDLVRLGEKYKELMKDGKLSKDDKETLKIYGDDWQAKLKQFNALSADQIAVAKERIKAENTAIATDIKLSSVPTAASDTTEKTR